MADLMEPPEGYTRTHIRWTTPAVGWMEFDAILRQSVVHDGEVTEHPVDSGADIADHYRERNVPVIIETLITNSPIDLPRTHTGNASAVQREKRVELPVPVFPGAPTTVGGFGITATKTVRVSTLDFEAGDGGGLDRINLMYEELRAIRSEVRVLTVSLGKVKGPDEGAEGGVFNDMILKKFTLDRGADTGNAVGLVLEFQHVKFTDVLIEDISAQVPRRPRSNKLKDKGQQGTKAVTDNAPTEQRVSVLAGLVGL